MPFIMSSKRIWAIDPYSNNANPLFIRICLLWLITHRMTWLMLSVWLGFQSAFWQNQKYCGWKCWPKYSFQDKRQVKTNDPLLYINLSSIKYAWVIEGHNKRLCVCVCAYVCMRRCVRMCVCVCELLSIAWSDIVTEISCHRTTWKVTLICIYCSDLQHCSQQITWHWFMCSKFTLTIVLLWIKHISFYCSFTTCSYWVCSMSYP